MLFWITLVSVYRWVMGICSDSVWVNSHLCNIMFGVPDVMQLAGVWAWLVAGLSFGLYVIQNMMSLSSAWNCIVGYGALSDQLNRWQSQDRLYDLMAHIVLGHSVDLQKCEEVRGWGARAAAVWREMQAPSRETQRGFMGHVDRAVLRCLVRAQAKKAAATGKDVAE